MSGLISYCVSPSGFLTLGFLIGLAIWAYRPFRRVGSAILAAGAAVFLMLSMGPVSYALLKPLEFRHAAYTARSEPSDAAIIVVMAGYALDNAYYPLSSKANAASMFRLVEAFEIWKQEPSRRVVVSGHKGVPQIMANVLNALGVTTDRIVVENASSNSYQSARNIRALIQEAPFILVTSAGHMPRCMGIFRKLGMQPIPAPTDYQAGQNPLDASFTPSIEHLRLSELALHEYIGIVWYRLRGYL